MFLIKKILKDNSIQIQQQLFQMDKEISLNGYMEFQKLAKKVMANNVLLIINID